MSGHSWYILPEQLPKMPTLLHAFFRAFHFRGFPSGSSDKSGTIQRRLAWPLRKDDTHKLRSGRDLLVPWKEMSQGKFFFHTAEKGFSGACVSLHLRTWVLLFFPWVLCCGCLFSLGKPCYLCLLQLLHLLLTKEIFWPTRLRARSAAAEKK